MKAVLNAENDSANSEIKKMISTATQQATEYNNAITDSNDIGFVGGELGDMLNQNTMQPQFADEAKKIKVPQFFQRTVPDLFGEVFELLEPENLSEGFSLSGQDSQVSFELATGEMYRVDIQEQGEAIPKYKRASKQQSEYIRDYLATLPPEKKIAQCTDMICAQINKNNRYATAEIAEYVRRIVSHMTDDELSAMETAIPTYARKIQDKIEKLEDVYRERQFDKWLDSGKIVCRDSYKFPTVITPAFTTDSIPNSLYEAEKDDLNLFEKSVIDVVVSFDNVSSGIELLSVKDCALMVISITTLIL